jgi:hypothetical protein
MGVFFILVFAVSAALSVSEEEDCCASPRPSPPATVLTVKIRQPSHEFTFGVGISFIPYPLVLTPVV